MNVNINETNFIAHIIDCNCLPTSVVGGGPAENVHFIMGGNQYTD